MRKSLAGACVLISLLLPLAAVAKSNSSHLNRERLEVGRALVEVTSDQVPDVLPYYADDITYFDPIVEVNGIEEMTEFLYRLFGSSPDLVTTVEDEIAIDDLYMATWTMVGTFVTDPNLPGDSYAAKGMSVIKFREKSTEVYFQRDYYTEGDIMLTIPPLTPVIQGFRDVYSCVVDPSPDPELICPSAPPPSP